MTGGPRPMVAIDQQVTNDGTLITPAAGYPFPTLEAAQKFHDHHAPIMGAAGRRITDVYIPTDDIDPEPPC